jgi:valyl-tRNA synthetase
MITDETFPKRYEPKAIEKKWQEHWYGNKAFSFEEKSSRPTYSIDTPPPTVSGKLHIGHVFSYTHTEIISRYKRLRGFNVYYPFGYDDNGLPTELLTEKEHGIRSYQTDRRKFRELCLQTGQKYSQLFSQLWKSLGFSCDFDSAYSTISPSSQKISQWSFVDLYKKNKVERRKEPALWCVRCGTSFAQAEIEDQHKAGKFIHVPFEVAGKNPIVIATTRPELLPACVAIFVHPEDERFKSYIGKKAKVPLFGHEITILADEKAQQDKGTGAVMCCTFGDTTDIQWWRQHKLPLREAISKFGKMTDIAGPLAGLKIEEAKEKAIELLKEQNLVLKIVDIPAETRVVNTHERCGTPVEFIVQSQWFIKVCDAKEELIALGRKIKWHPEFMRSRYENWVENLSWDWAISRQRAFGVPIPAWYSEDGKHIYVSDAAHLPIDPTESKPPIPCPSGEWIADTDVLDTWATSSITPLINARFTLDNERKNFLPMSMRPQAHDIIRTWAFYTIAKSYFHFKEMPWKDIVISGHVQKPGTKVDAAQMAGQDFARKTKISKSKDGETFSPEKIIERNCADAIRLWSAGASLGTDILFDEGGMAESLKFLNKLWNATRFALLNLENFIPEKNFSSSHPVDQWILSRLSQVGTYYQKSFDQYEIHGAKVELDKFFWIDFCDNYIEFIKWRCLSSDSKISNEAKQSLYQVLFKILQLYAPFAPHITEEIYNLYFKQFEKTESIHKTNLEFLPSVNEKSLLTGKLLVGTIGLVRAYKSKNQLGFKIPMENLKIFATSEQHMYLESTLEDIKNFAQAKMIALYDIRESANTFEQEFDSIKIEPIIDPKAVEEFKAAKKTAK